MIIVKKAINRRTVLRGIGASLALPLLDAMVPALTALTRTAAKAVKRFGVVYVPNGVIMEQWTPSAEGAGFAFTPTLKALEPFRDRLVVLTGLQNVGGGAHAVPGAAFLTGVAPLPTKNTSNLRLGISMDQIAAKALGQETVLPSLELSLENADSALVPCDVGYSCIYLNISWRNETTPMPRETNPRVVFERLFGDVGSTDPKLREARARGDRSILDSIGQKIDRLQRRLGPGDSRKLDEYLDAVREIERRLQVAERRGAREVPVVDSPAGIPVTYEEHARLMFEMQRLAYQTDLTRVSTFMMGRELSGATYPQIGVSEGHHPISHHGGDETKIAGVAKINRHHVGLFAEYVEKLRSTPDGDGSLLDHTTLLYGSALGDGNRHDSTNVPIVLVGGGAGRMKGGRHIRYPKDTTSLASLHLTLLDNLGIPAERLGPTTGRVAELTGIEA